MATNEKANEGATARGGTVTHHPHDPCKVPAVRLSKTINRNNLLEEAFDILRVARPTWDRAQVRTKTFTAGITNTLTGFFVHNNPVDMVLIRIYGAKTELLINRAEEIRVMELLCPLGCAPQLHVIFDNGLCYDYVTGEDLDEDDVRHPVISRKIAQVMAKWHSMDIDDDQISKEPKVFRILWRMFDLLSEIDIPDAEKYRFNGTIPSKSILENEIRELVTVISNLESPIVFCHNDLLVRNIIRSKENGEIRFIDFEYCGYNYQAFDIANHFCEFAGVDSVDYSRYPDKESQLAWLRTYLPFWFSSCGKDPDSVTESDLELLYVQVNKCSLAAHLMWSLWAFVQAKFSEIDFNYSEYGVLRLSEYFSKKKEFLALGSTTAILATDTCKNTRS